MYTIVLPPPFGESNLTEELGVLCEVTLQVSGRMQTWTPICFTPKPKNETNLSKQIWKIIFLFCLKFLC